MYRNQMKEDLNKLAGHSCCVAIDLVETKNNTRTYAATFTDDIVIKFIEPFVRPDKPNDMTFVFDSYLIEKKKYNSKCLNRARWENVVHKICDPSYIKSYGISNVVDTIIEEIKIQQAGKY